VRAGCKPLVFALLLQSHVFGVTKHNHPSLWAKFAMRKIDDGDGIRELNTRDLVIEFQDDVLNLDRDDIDDIEWQLVQSQYSYIKFGLILEKIRNRAWWNKCTEKFQDFRQFCQMKTNLSIWQVINAIKSAQVAVKLTFLGFDELPRNASQALKLSELSIERLAEVWGNILAKCQGHKITADAIAREINPDAQPMRSSVMLPVELADKLSREAVMRGISIAEYIGELMDLEQADADAVEPVTQEFPMAEIISDLLDRDEIEPSLSEVVSIEQIRPGRTSIDRFRDYLDNVGSKFVTRSTKAASYG
jgi:hypothetical protein